MDDDIDIDLCENCFVKGRDDHWHVDGWLRIDPDGTHTELPAPEPSTPSDAPPQPDRLVRAVTASIEGRPCGACSQILGLGEQITQLRCRCVYHSGCLQPEDECCPACTPSSGSSTKAAIDQIYVKTATKTLVFGVKPTDTVLRLKEYIAEEDQIPISRLQLTWRNLGTRDLELLHNFIGSPEPLELHILAN